MAARVQGPRQPRAQQPRTIHIQVGGEEDHWDERGRGGGWPQVGQATKLWGMAAEQFGQFMGAAYERGRRIFAEPLQFSASAVHEGP